MSGRLDGRVALVTGGSRGIGAAIARAYLDEGAAVALCHLNDEEGAAEIVAHGRKAGRAVYAAECDVGQPDRLAAFVDQAGHALGPIDIAVSNAGISGETAFADMELDRFETMIDVHLRALFVLSKAVLPGMRARGFGRLIAVTSQLAYKGAPGLVHYTAAKAGMTGFVRALSQEVARDGVLVNAIAPGPVDTRLSDDLSTEWKAWKTAQLPLGRFGRAEEIAPTAVLLASEDGSFYVGQTLSPNGGDVLL